MGDVFDGINQTDIHNIFNSAHVNNKRKHLQCWACYICEGGYHHGYLHAFGELDPNAPEAPTITGELKGRIRVEYEYTFNSNDPNGDDVYYYIEWAMESLQIGSVHMNLERK